MSAGVWDSIMRLLFTSPVTRVGSRAEPVGCVSICAQAGMGGEDWRLQLSRGRL